MLVGLCAPRRLLLLLGCVWLTGILDVDVVDGFSSLPQGKTVNLRDKQHQPKPKWKENHSRTYLNRGCDNNLVSRWSLRQVREKQQQQLQHPKPKPSRKEQNKPVLYWGNNLPDIGVVDKVMTKDIFSLESIRKSLIRQEETLIFALIERAAFCRNEGFYTEKNFTLKPDSQCAFPATQERECTFLEFLLCETEKLHARIRRYQSPEEYPFFSEFLPNPVLPKLDYAHILAPNSINENGFLLEKYINVVVPSICSVGDDEQYGSSVLHDISALQALSRRVHFGLFVGESKYQENPTKYTELCKAQDVEAVYQTLTNAEVEKMVLERAFLKALTYCKDFTFVSDPGDNLSFKIEPEIIRSLYANLIIPVTKKTQLMYIFARCGVPLDSPSSFNSMFGI